MKILICGASGLIGSNMLRICLENDWEVLGTYYSHELPGLLVLDTLNMDDEDIRKVEVFDPDVIVHCGALTHVDYCEDHIEESYQKTVQSTINLVGLSNQIGCKFVYLSTDYVFDGVSGPYIESDPLNPLSVYGRHKLEAELYVQEKVPSHIIARVTNVYGTEDRNKNFVSRILNLALSDADIKLSLPRDQYATPTNARDISRAIYHLLEGGYNGVYHLSGLEYMNRVDLALEVMKYFPGRKYSLESMATADMNQKAPRPLRAGLLRIKFSNLFPEFKWTTVGDFVSNQLSTSDTQAS